MHKDSSRTAINLASEIDSSLMAYSSSPHMTEAELKKRLSDTLSTASMTPVSIDDAVIFAPLRSTGSARWIFPNPVPSLA